MLVCDMVHGPFNKDLRCFVIAVCYLEASSRDKKIDLLFSLLVSFLDRPVLVWALVKILMCLKSNRQKLKGKSFLFHCQVLVIACMSDQEISICT